MIIRLVNDSVSLDDPDDFHSLKVTASETTVNSQRDLLDSLGEWTDSEHVFIDPVLLVRLAGERSESPDWQASLDGMMGFASRAGWVDSAGRVRVHLEIYKTQPIV